MIYLIMPRVIGALFQVFQSFFCSKFSSGSASSTGVEAISNAVPFFKNLRHVMQLGRLH